MKKREAEGFHEEDLNVMPVPEFLDFVREWVHSSTRPA
jgi:hypothetical protein